MRKFFNRLPKKSLSVMLSLVFAFACVCPAAAADSATVTTVDALVAALSSAGTTQTTVVLGSDITSAKALKCAANSDIVLDLNGKTLTLSSFTAILKVNNAKLTVKNGTVIMTEEETSVFDVSNSGTLILEKVIATADGAAVITANDSTVILNGVTLDTNNDGKDAVAATNSTVKDGAGKGITNGKLLVTEYVPGGSEDYKTNIKVSVPDMYLITVPEELDFGMVTYTNSDTDRYVERTGTVTVEYFVSDVASKLNVNVRGSGDNGAFKLTDGAKSIGYTVKDSSGSAVAVNGKLAEFSSAGSTTFKAVIDRQELKKSGNYSGKLIFDVSIK